METKRDLTTLSDSLLFAYLDNPEFRTAESMKEVIAELERRGNVLTEEQLSKANKTSSDPVDNVYDGTPVIHPGYKTRSWKYNVVEDASAPMLYSQRAIWVFSILFGVVFGAGMLAVNIKNIGHKGKATWIVVFGTLYMIIAIIMLNKLNTGSSMSFISNAVGAVVLDFFWHRYIGYNTLYRTKPIWTPLIIALVIEIPLLLLIIFGQGQ